MALDAKDLAQSYIIDMPVNDVVHMDTGYTDAVVDGQGITLEHWRAMPCPIGKGDAYDVRKMHSDHSGCSNGFIYEKGGDITCLFVGNSKHLQALDVGFLTGSTVQITVPRYYNGSSAPVVMATLDRLYLKGTLGDQTPINVIATQLFEHNISGMDRLKYPANNVEVVVDSHGKRYYQGTDFNLGNGGQLVWSSTKQPGMDPSTGKGEICSVRYQYTPYWYVSNLIHEIRVVRQGDKVERTPMTALLQREYVFENEQNDQGLRPGSNDSLRQATAPRSGSFGTR